MVYFDHLQGQEKVPSKLEVPRCSPRGIVPPAPWLANKEPFTDFLLLAWVAYVHFSVSATAWFPVTTAAWEKDQCHCVATLPSTADPAPPLQRM